MRRATRPSRRERERRAESDIAIRFVYENDYIEISAKAASAKRKLKRFALPLLYRANRTAGKSLKCYYDQIWEFVFDYIFRKCV